MSGPNQSKSPQSPDQHSEVMPRVRIVRFIPDKTVNVRGPSTGYQVFLESPGTPLPVWRDIFGREWHDLNPAPRAGEEGNLLVMHSVPSSAVSNQILDPLLGIEAKETPH